MPEPQLTTEEKNRKEMQTLLLRLGSHPCSPPISKGGRLLQFSCVKCRTEESLRVGPRHFCCVNINCNWSGDRDSLLALLGELPKPKKPRRSIARLVVRTLMKPKRRLKKFRFSEKGG